MSKLLVVLALIALSGCAARPQYQWGGYDDLLYKSYKDPLQVETMRTSLERNIGELEQAKQKVAPGLYAELGTLYLQKGDSKSAVVWYSKERDAWPESKGLMNTMIKNVAIRDQAPKETR